MNEVMDNEARVNITWAGQNGDLEDPVVFDSTDEDIRQWVTEAVQNGGVAGIEADTEANFTDFVIDRFAATEARPWSLLSIRPKTPFGTWPEA